MLLLLTQGLKQNQHYLSPLYNGLPFRQETESEGRYPGCRLVSLKSTELVNEALILLSHVIYQDNKSSSLSLRLTMTNSTLVNHRMTEWYLQLITAHFRCIMTIYSMKTYITALTVRCILNHNYEIGCLFDIIPCNKKRYLLSTLIIIIINSI